MLTENDVVIAVSIFLKQNGYSIDQALTTWQRGIDIEAISPSGKRCLVEAKGATSSKRESNRYGKEFSIGQVRSHIGVALIKAFQTLQLNPDSEVVIALPGNEGHRKTIDSMATPIKHSGVKIYFVNHDSSVEVYDG